MANRLTTLSYKDKSKTIKDVIQLALSRPTKMCNFLQYKDTKVVFRRYASLSFVAGIDSSDDELITLEIVHRYVEQMDKCYGNFLISGEMQESGKKGRLKCIAGCD
ncbi:hypothetical protein C7212DRAFT_355813 [Tuber magnatum]|uniref:AP complex mu/sigma subunit domain-containing protein n=1 Tax=Tuber magnatum TaxID=42249 RepID=A0A317T4S0_9PEZI|nr:hypothetical protein C7212DRAFT_355813 [Tuber magnatum]